MVQINGEVDLEILIGNRGRRSTAHLGLQLGLELQLGLQLGLQLWLQLGLELQQGLQQGLQLGLESRVQLGSGRSVVYREGIKPQP